LGPLLSASAIETCSQPQEYAAQQSIAQALFHSPILDDWANKPESHVLYIRAGPPGEETTQPLSFFSAKLPSALPTADPAVCVHYSCGLHTGNVHTMMRSLLGQLLTQKRYGFERVDITYADIAKIRSGDLKTLCYTFGKLIKQLPRASVVYCIIDNIMVWEICSRSRDTRRVIDYLLGLLGKRKEGFLKFLLSCGSDDRVERGYG